MKRFLMCHTTKVMLALLSLLAIVVVLTLATCRDKDRQTEQQLNPKLQLIFNEFNLLQNNGKGKQSIKFLNNEYPKLNRLSSLDYWYIYWNKSMYYLNYEHNLQKAELYADSCILTSKQLSEKISAELVKTYFLQGDVLLAGEKYSQAFKAYYDGRAYATKYLDPCKLSFFTSQLGNVKLKQENYQEAVSYFKQALAENKTCGSGATFEYNFVYVQSKINTIAIVYERMGQLDSALTYYQQALDFIEKAAPKNLKDSIFAKKAYGVVLGNLGGVYKKLGRYTEAEEKLLQSIGINDRQNYEYQDAMTVKLKLAELYLIKNQVKSAYQLLNQLTSSLIKLEADKSSQNGIQLNTYRLLQQYHEKTGKIGMAYAMQQKYYLLKDSLEKLKIGLKKVDMDVAFELNEQKYKTKILSQQNEIKNAYLYVFGLVVVLAGFLAGFLWRDIKKSRIYIDKLKKLNLHNQQTLAALEISHAENDKIMRIVAHDLRNPLSGISGVVALMLEEDGFSEESKEELSLIKSTSDNSLSLVNELLQINSSMEGIEMSHVDMGELVQYCSDLLKIKAETKNQQIITQSFECYVLANREKLWRVLGNLIGNAIKFSPQGGNIAISMIKNDLELIVSVSDQGIGIPIQMAEKLFEMFTPAKRPGTSGEESFGMGLSIAKKIIEGHDGKIWFESEDGKGSTFYFSLPIHQLSV